MHSQFWKRRSKQAKLIMLCVLIITLLINFQTTIDDKEIIKKYKSATAGISNIGYTFTALKEKDTLQVL